MTPEHAPARWVGVLIFRRSKARERFAERPACAFSSLATSRIVPILPEW